MTLKAITKISTKTKRRLKNQFKTGKSLVTNTELPIRSGLCNMSIACAAGSTVAVVNENAK